MATEVTLWGKTLHDDQSRLLLKHAMKEKAMSHTVPVPHHIHWQLSSQCHHRGSVLPPEPTNNIICLLKLLLILEWKELVAVLQSVSLAFSRLCIIIYYIFIFITFSHSPFCNGFLSCVNQSNCNCQVSPHQGNLWRAKSMPDSWKHHMHLVLYTFLFCIFKQATNLFGKFPQGFCLFCGHIIQFPICLQIYSTHTFIGQSTFSKVSRFQRRINDFKGSM